MMLGFHLLCMFQSTLPRGERLSGSNKRSVGICFNPRSREGSDGKTSYFHIKYSVSIHAPARGATPHLLGDFRIICVSIHAPARGATCQRKALIQSKSVSIHAPARGATLSLFHQSFPASRFNPRSREGSDPTIAYAISVIFCFNPRSREGSDNIVTDNLPCRCRFQSTLPRGERRYMNVPSCTFECFNPRSREGSDTSIIGRNWSRNVSIHAPARGATRPVPPAYKTIVGFNPRSREGSDRGQVLNL